MWAIAVWAIPVCHSRVGDGVHHRRRGGTSIAHIVGSYTAFLPYLAAGSGSSFISALIWPLCAS
jgi:hypothetical protein